MQGSSIPGIVFPTIPDPEYEHYWNSEEMGLLLPPSKRLFLKKKRLCFDLQYFIYPESQDTVNRINAKHICKKDIAGGGARAGNQVSCPGKSSGVEEQWKEHFENAIPLFSGLCGFS
ncbi:uncharacterized protein LOC111546682 [Piliocolobus tephrosceles]|uniref:uncharacterized protein LOC111546682 n=1 Tax=Piliocolobus tephrosceles TaxID=591936 RepID=UPI000C2ACE46|nr:uncharacterized protein LOC111546682 [Piliocolobus tephrosceles]